MSDTKEDRRAMCSRCGADVIDENLHARFHRDQAAQIKRAAVVPCRRCKGSGKQPGYHNLCGRCGGSGEER